MSWGLLRFESCRSCQSPEPILSLLEFQYYNTDQDFKEKAFWFCHFLWSIVSILSNAEIKYCCNSLLPILMPKQAGIQWHLQRCTHLGSTFWVADLQDYQRKTTPQGYFAVPVSLSEFMFSEIHATSNFPQTKGLIEVIYHTDANRTRTAYCCVLSDSVETIFCLLSLREWTSLKFASLTERPDFKM